MKIGAHNLLDRVIGEIAQKMVVANTCKAKICGDGNAHDLTMNLHVVSKEEPVIASGTVTVELFEYIYTY